MAGVPSLAPLPVAPLPVAGLPVAGLHAAALPAAVPPAAVPPAAALPAAAPLLSAGYHGPPELTFARAFTSWTLDVPVLIVVLLAAGCYLAATRRVRKARPWPVSRIFLAGIGLGVLVIATMSWLGVYQDILFWVRAVQTILLLLLVPLFLALGRPLTLAIAALPEPLGRRAEAAIRGKPARVLTFPLITAVILIATPFVLYFTGWYAAAFHSDLVRELTYLALIAPGFLFFWTLLRVDPVPKEYPYLASLWITGAEVVFDAFLGIAVIADQHLIAGPHYTALARPWGPNLRTDQVLGGGALWILGDLVGLPFLAAMLIQMIREDEEEAAQIDAELDARDAAAAARDAATARDAAKARDAAAAGRGAREGQPADVEPEQVAPPDGGAGDRPWWESDPRFVGRFRATGPPTGHDS